jgi:hypothetical protein
MQLLRYGVLLQRYSVLVLSESGALNGRHMCVAMPSKSPEPR